jgi:hypothetical protein
VVLALPLYFLSNFVIRRYREHLLAWVRKTKVVQFIKASRFYRIYSTLSDVDLT